MITAKRQECRLISSVCHHPLDELQVVAAVRADASDHKKDCPPVVMLWVKKKTDARACTLKHLQRLTQHLIGAPGNRDYFAARLTRAFQSATPASIEARSSRARLSSTT